MSNRGSSAAAQGRAPRWPGNSVSDSPPATTSAPATALQAADAYRRAFVPSEELDRPYVAVSADVVVAPDDESAKRLAAGYALWVRSIRQGRRGDPVPGPRRGGPAPWSDDDRALVRDRVDTQLSDRPRRWPATLVRLQEATDGRRAHRDDDHPQSRRSEDAPSPCSRGSGSAITTSKGIGQWASSTG